MEQNEERRTVMNNISIAGHLGADPEVRFTSTGKKVTTLRVACRSRKGQTESTIWYRVTIWGEQFDKMVSYLKKGSAVIVTGELQKPEIFNDREGKPQISMDVTAHNIQFSPFGKPASGGGSPQQPGQESQALPKETGPGTPFGAFQETAAKGATYDDEVPF